MIHHILVATDGSETAERAVRFSAQVADRRQQAEVTVVYVHLRVHPALNTPVLSPEQPLEVSQALNEETSENLSFGQEIVRKAVHEIQTLVTLPDITVKGRVVVSDGVDRGILQVADEIKADIIVVGTRGLSALRGAIMGSVSHSLIEKASCPVLVVK